MKFFSWCYPHRQHIKKLSKLNISFESFHLKRKHSSVQLLSYVRLLVTPMDCSTPGFPVHHQLPVFAQTHMSIKSVMPSNYLILCHALLLCLQSFPASSLVQWVSSLHQVAKALEFQLQHESFQWTFRTDFLEDGLVGSPCNPRDSEEFSTTPQFKSINSLVLSFLYNPTLTSIHDYWKNHSFGP